MSAGRRRLLALAAVVAAGALPQTARADEPPLPAGTEVAAGVPPFVPSPAARADPAALTAWVERTLATGRAVAGTRRGVELLYSAAHVQAWELENARVAGLTFREAYRTAPKDDPMGALALLRMFRILVSLREWNDAGNTGSALEAYAERYVPVDDDVATAERFTRLQHDLRGAFQADMAGVYAALGKHGLAALRLERAATADATGSGPPASLWEHAALERFRAGQADLAHDDVRNALAADPDPAQRARLLFWDLHLKHGLLTPEGELRPTGAWPGRVYLDDLDLVLRELHGNPHVGDLLLSAASSALLARAEADAFALYQKALADPELGRRMARDESLPAAFLPAVAVAIRLERFDEGEALLAEVERLAAEPIPLAASLRVRLKLARAAAGLAEEEHAPPPVPAPDAPHPPPELGPPIPAEVPPAELPAAEAPARSAPSATESADARGSLTGSLLAALAALLLLLLLPLLQRRGR